MTKEAISKDLDAVKSDISETQNQWIARNSIFGGLITETAKEYTTKFNNSYDSLKKINATKIDDKITKEYLTGIINMNKAWIELSTLGKEFDSKRVYELRLKAEGLDIKDISDAVEVYHIQTKKIIDIQKQEHELPTLSNNNKEHTNIENVFARNKTEFQRSCEQIVLNLDRYASRMFGINITTPANFDPKQREPHQAWGEINVGYVNNLQMLWRIIAHEGPLGHQAHNVLSENAQLKHDCMHTSEGLAILGEYITMREFFPEEKYSLLALVLNAKRLMNDSRNAAIEKLFYYDRMPANKIAEELSSPFINKNVLAQLLGSKENLRESTFEYGGAAYFAGHRKILDVYRKVCNEISNHRNTMQENEVRQKLMKTMYTGNRPITIMDMEVDAAIAEIEKKYPK